jgi:hypothetical protein
VAHSVKDKAESVKSCNKFCVDLCAICYMKKQRKILFLNSNSDSDA